MPAKPLSPAGRRAILRRDDVEATLAERRFEHAIDAAWERRAPPQVAGKGQALVFDDGLATQDAQWLVHHVLKNAGYIPPFVELGQQVEAARQASARAEAAWRQASTAAGRKACAEALEAAWENENALIRRWNDKAPSPSLQRYPLPLPRRWARIQETSPSDAPVAGPN